MSVINGYGAYQQFSYDAGKKDQKAKGASDAGKTGKYERASKTGKAKENSGVSNQVQLSENAKKLLEELKEKYQNMDFFVADYETDEEAQSYLSRGTKEYSVLIDPETLEAMAADSATKEKYLGIIDEATGNLAQMKEELSEDEENNVVSIGITIGKDGTVSYFAELEKMSEKQRERIQKSKEEQKTEEAEEAKRQKTKEAKERLNAPKDNPLPHIPKTTQKVSLKADSVEDLLEQIRSVDWSKIKATEHIPAGGRMDFSV